jgi:hypothetical protein
LRHHRGHKPQNSAHPAYAFGAVLR